MIFRLKQSWQTMPRLLKFLLLYTFAFTLLLIVMRVVFYIRFDMSDAPLVSKDFWMSMWLGGRFDLRVVIATILPLFFLGWIKWVNPFSYRPAKIFWHVAFTIVFALISLVYIVDIGHYSYLDTRINFTVMRFLEDASISANMVWESYPVIWITLVWVISVALFAWFLERLHGYVARSTPLVVYRWWEKSLIGVVAFILVFIGAYSKFSQYPLRWSEATFSKHPFAAQLTYNPVHYLFDTWKNGRINYHLDNTKNSYATIAEFLGVSNPDPQALQYQRPVAAKGEMTQKPNIVLIIVESLAAHKTSLTNNPLDPSPNLQQLAQNGLYFQNFFTPSTGTARSVYTTITSMPDVELKGTSSRNPLIVDQHTIMDDFTGYEKYYFIGGSASWGNIRGILTNNIKGLHLYEEEAYSSPHNDVWGISDLDLFKEANAVLAKEKKPFIAIIQTAGNHPPYTIPEGLRDFEIKHPGDASVQEYGFFNEGEYNSYRLMDYSIGQFVAMTKAAGYDQNTIFALWGDHGISGSAGKHRPPAESSSNLSLGSHRVPFVIWSPGLINEPQVIDTVVSEVDVLATMAGLAGQSYTATTMGRDMFDERYQDRRQAFTIMHTNPPTIGMINGNHYFRMFGEEDVGALYDITSQTPTRDIQAQFPDEAKQLRDLTLAYYYTTQYMAYHNKNDAVKPPVSTK
jgi:phosphoglycerol transferase MdoB-like AlkP superfamily enzyme